MKGISLDNKNHFYVTLILTLSFLVLESTLNKQFFLIIGILCWGLIYINGRSKYNHEFLIVRMLILSIPLSFMDIFGQTYGVSTISWFNIFLLIILLTYVLKYFAREKVYFNYLSLLSMLLMLISIIPVLRGQNIGEALKQYINIMVMLVLVIVGNSFKYSLSNREKKTFKI